MTHSFIESAQNTLTIEIDAVTALKNRIDDDFVSACEILLQCQGRVVVTGMGKSGHIANKIAATLASTGTPAFFVHPGEASHGDLGMITSQDVVLALSNSGSTAEILTIVPLIKRMGAKLISMTGDANSPLAEASEVHLDASVAREACPHDLAPTSSTTVSLVLGDTLAVALLEARGFTPEDFAFSHPGGALGRKLLLKVSDIMHKGAEIPCVDDDALIQDALFEMSSKGLGMTTILSAEGVLLGIFTDGDLRRCLDIGYDMKTTPITSVMSKTCKTIIDDMLAVESLNIMESSSITSLVVTDDQRHPVGVIHLHDILKAGVA
ncbi:MAG: KpsF/GutQ family sugar-phosphate isomerase [Pseudomonadales bacterium]|nr:KpsF/GutQ family sugar-phosphate isomerase [Pseudomonadales bacterium]